MPALMIQISNAENESFRQTLSILIFCLFKANSSSESLDPLIPNQPKEGEENFVGDSEIIALGGASNETKDRPLG